MDEITGLLQQLIDLVKEASPVIWGAYIKQVYVYTAQKIVGFLVLFITGLQLYKQGKKDYEINKGEYESVYEYYFAGFGLAMFIAFCLFISAISVINPEYQAIQMIVESLK
jgi:hypothetical protein